MANDPCEWLETFLRDHPHWASETKFVPVDGRAERVMSPRCTKAWMTWCCSHGYITPETEENWAAFNDRVLTERKEHRE